MNLLYHWIGVVVFWVAAVCIVLAGSLRMWEAEWFGRTKRRLRNAALAFRTYVLGYRLPFSRNVCTIVFQIMERADTWERNMAAVHVKHARKIGYTSAE